MTSFILTALLLIPLPQSDEFTRFSFCRESPGGQYGDQCFDLDSEGKGLFKFAPQGDDTVEVEFEFSARGHERFIELLEATDYLEAGDRYESERQVANMGIKTFVVDGPWGQREAAFNYTTIGEASDLSTFFERLVTQEILLFDIEIALDFDRLGIPDRLDLLERAIDSRRIADPGRVEMMLERIEQDTGLVNYARTTATRLKEELEDSN
jgi:hypothetical protein